MNLNSISQVQFVPKILIDITILVGLFLNGLTFMVFSCKPFKSNSMGVYCRFLAIADSFTLVHFLFDVVSYSLGSPFEASSDLACKLFYYIITSLSSVSVWIIIALDIDKLLAMLNKTNKLAFVGAKWFPPTIVAIIYVLNLVQFVEIPLFIALSNLTISNTTFLICNGPEGDQFTYIAYIYLINSNVVPFVLMIAITIATSMCLFRSARKLLKNTTANESYRRRHKRDIKFAFSSVALSVVFVVFQVPVVFGFMFQFTLELLFDLLLWLFFLNFASRFLGHLVFNSIFRETFFKMIFDVRRKNSSRST